MVQLLLDFVQGKSPEVVTTELAKKPFAVKVRGHLEDPTVKRRYVFSYNMIDSDFNQLLVWDCRGTILECEILENVAGTEVQYNWRPVAVPFRKFFNAGEKYNQHIPDGFDWSTAEIFPKEDGSLLKLYWYEGTWRWGTNNGICAKGASLSNDVRTVTKYQTFHDLIDVVSHNVPFDTLDQNHTYLFELVSPYNRVVVDVYDKIQLILLAVRCNKTFVEKPTFQIKGLQFDLRTAQPINLQQDLKMLMSEAAKKPGNEFEGFVVRDSRGYRMKIKNPKYVLMHHTKSSKDSLPAEFLILSGWLKSELDEILAVRPDLEVKANELVPTFQKYLDTMMDYEDLLKKKFGNNIDLNSFSKEEKKQFALTVKNMHNSAVFFALFMGKLINYADGKPFVRIEDYLRSLHEIEDVKSLYKNIEGFGISK